ncbi:MAG: winged helix-turn-helix transcriptional regulator [Thermoplasmatota archaeon]
MLLAILVRNGRRTRERILEALRHHPGMNTSELRAEVGLAWATAAYHLKILQRQGFVHLEPKRRGHLCFPIDIPAHHRGLVLALRDPDTARVIAALLDGHAMGISQLSSSLGLSEQSVRTRLANLHGTGLVVKRGELRPRFSLHPGIPTEFLGRHEDARTDPDPERKLPHGR